MKPSTRQPSPPRRAALALAALTFAAAAVVFAAPAAHAAAGQPVVNVNKAGAAELALLPRVGPAVSQRIVEFRDENGPFKSAEDLMLVRGIGEKTFELIEPYVTLSGDTTLRQKVRGARAAPADEDGEGSGSR